MNKYYIEILVEKANHAGSKARDDVALFLEDSEVTNQVFDREISKFEKVLFTKTNIKDKLKKTKPKDMIIISYPLFFRKVYTDYLIKVIKNKKLSSVLLIHDIESLRQNFNKKQIDEEIQLINNFDILISHNQSMTNWLIEKGVTSHIIDLQLFDYYNTTPIKESLLKDSGVIFAGNLGKSKFLSKISEMKNKINLYGPNPQENYSKNTNYLGSFSPNQLPLFMEGSYGLIWDGDSSEECRGISGNYLKYNNPHKTSLYLSCGIPVVIWRKAALAPFIQRNNLGLCVDSLKEMDQLLSSITDEEYRNMKLNAVEIANKVRTGFFIKEAIKKAEHILMEEF
ncbi:sugar transferase [Priestia megaterium]|uniref:sugar transferase n=1 Tax=Priestia megaterium TaxID=1404 RepID=UPI000BFE9B48|nr:sugar transferase [Priestia megaterium]PGR03776.1 hypothetical protein COA23_21495 [Priestia megaterium]